MTRSSKTRRAKARAKKRMRLDAKSGARASATESALPALSATDKHYLIGFAIFSLMITAVYFWMGGRNILVFPAVLCICAAFRKFWTRPIRQIVDFSS